MTHIATATQSPSADLARHAGHAFQGSDFVEVSDCRDVPEIRSATRSDRDRFEAAMTMAFSADPAARWA